MDRLSTLTSIGDNSDRPFLVQLKDDGIAIKQWELPTWDDSFAKAFQELGAERRRRG